MAGINFTLNEEDLTDLFLHKDSAVANLLSKILNQVLEAQVNDHLQAEPYERSEDRKGYRNGSRSRSLITRSGILDLQVPRVRNGSFTTEMFERYQRSEQAMIMALVEMVINGVSTRKVDNIVHELCGASISKSQVSELCKVLDPIVAEWRSRPLDTQAYPFLLVDAVVVKSRGQKKVRQKCLMTATGIRADGYREILGCHLSDSETGAGWNEFFISMLARGLHSVDIIVSDDHLGLVKAIGQNFIGCSWQRCQAHFTRNIMDVCPKSAKDVLAARLRDVFNASDEDTARRLMNATLAEFQGKASKSMDTLERGFDDTMAIMQLPQAYRKRLRTTNTVERMNEEIRRREKVIRIFPNDESVIRLMGAVLLEIDERWTSGNHYFNMSSYWQHKAEQELNTSIVDTRVGLTH
jgi:transposase-like protein